MRLKKLAPLFLTLSATLFAARFGIDHIGRIVRIADPQIAPNGKSIALVVSRTNYEEDRYDPELVLIDIATHNQRTLTRDRRGVSQARWSPDGSRLAFLATVDTRPQIFVLPIPGGDAWQVTGHFFDDIGRSGQVRLRQGLASVGNTTVAQSPPVAAPSKQARG